MVVRTYAFLVVMLLTVAGCLTGVVGDAGRVAATSERSDLAPEAGGGGM